MTAAPGRSTVHAEEPVHLALAHWTDLAELARLEALVFPDDPWSEASWWAELAQRPRRQYVVLTDRHGAVVGYGGLDHAGEVADVMTVVLAPQVRGHGLGGRLLDELERCAVLRGAEHLMLEVRADNDAALALYAGRGFAEVSRRRGYYRPGGTDAVVMRKTLSRNGADDV